MTPDLPLCNSATHARQHTRFSPVVSIASPFPRHLRKKAVVATIAFVVVAVAVVVALQYLPAGWLSVRWETREQVTLGVSILVLMIPLALAARISQRKRLNCLYSQWKAEAPRLPAQVAAATFYPRLTALGRRARAAAVTAYLADVPEREGRVIMVGDQSLAPFDDGTLSEECDVLEGRTRGARRWLIVALCIPLVLQFGVILVLGGLNPLRWPPQAWIIGAPALLNLAIVAIVCGYVRLPGTVVLAAPGRVRHTTVRGHLEFTPADSVMIVVAFDRARAVAVYRSDGSRATVQLPGAAGPGLQNLINRWCLLTTQPPAAE